MWCSDPLRCAALAGALLLGLGACGFRPLHVPPDPAQAGAGTLAETRIQPIQGRVGQQLHNLLRDRLNPAGQPRQPAYLLEIDLRQSIREQAIQTDETATRANLILRASYSLRAAATGAVLFHGSLASVNGYNILTDLYATRIAEEGALRRGLRDMAENLQLRLASHFVGRRSAAAP
jgi:LPS-assembly lipoprotein